MKRRIGRLYEIEFSDEQSIKAELEDILKDSADLLKETRKALQTAAYATEDRRRLAKRLFNEKKAVHVQENDLLWAYFSPKMTRNNQTKFRSFYVRKVTHEKNRIVLFVRFAYEKNKRWFDLEK